MSASVIPLFTVFLMGVGAVLKHLWKVYKGDTENLGALASTLYLTAVYFALTYDYIGHGSPFLRVGVLLLFVDKVFSFLYDLTTEIRRRKYVK